MRTDKHLERAWVSPQDKVCNVHEVNREKRQLSQWRTIEQSHTGLREIDSGCCVSKHWIRELTRKKLVATMNAESKIWLDFNELLELLNMKKEKGK